MAQFWTDFSGYVTDSLPSDWSRLWYNWPGTLLVREKAGMTGGKCLEAVPTSTGWSCERWGIGSFGDVEAVTCGRANVQGQVIGLAVRAASSPVGYGYWLCFNGSGNWTLGVVMNGNAAHLAVVTYSWTAGTLYYFRLRAIGNQLKAKVWEKGQPEPELWGAEVTDSSLSSGQVGIFHYLTGAHDWDIFGVGTNGDPAPIAPSSHLVVGELHFTGSATMSGSAVRIRTAGLPLIGQAIVEASAVKIAAGRLDLHGAATFRLAGLALRVPAGASVITKDDYFSKNQPAKGEKVANLIEVQTSPLQPVAVAEEVYKSNDPISLLAGETQTLTVTYNDKPVIEAVASLTEAGAGISIAGATYYAWGAMLTLHNAGTGAETCKVVVTGRPLKVAGKELVTVSDAQSILEYRVLKYAFKENALVQTRAMAKAIAAKLLASYKDDRRDISLDWRGNPALILADVISVPEYQKGPIEQWGNFYVTKQELEYDGTLKAALEGRKM